MTVTVTVTVTGTGRFRARVVESVVVLDGVWRVA